MDATYSMLNLSRVGGPACDPNSTITLVVPLNTPRGAGLRWWRADSAEVEEAVGSADGGGGGGGGGDREDGEGGSYQSGFSFTLPPLPKWVHAHAIHYRRGTLVQFPAMLTHAIREWPYSEWASQHARMALQAFAIRCGDRWMVYH